MPMQRSSNKRGFRRLVRNLLRDRRAVAELEFALMAPVLVAIVVGAVEIGRVMAQAAAVEKGLHSGAVYAARLTLPLSEASRTTIENLVRTGDPSGLAPLLATGWSKAAAVLTIEDTDSFSTGSTHLPVIRLSAEVPFDPLLPGFLGLDSYKIRLSHEQTFIGD